MINENRLDRGGVSRGMCSSNDPSKSVSGRTKYVMTGLEHYVDLDIVLKCRVRIMKN